MEHRALGTTELRLSAVTFGAMGEAGDEGRRVAVIEAAVEAGITAIDTAPLYGLGSSERIVGRALARLRTRPLVLTKVGLRWDDASEHGEPLFRTKGADGTALVVRRDSRPESVLLEIERSLERLRASPIDVVQLHHRDRRTPIGETMAALREAVRGGSVRAVGVSNFSPAEVEEAKAALGDVPLASVQEELSLVARGAIGTTLAAARKHGLGFLAYSPLGRGLLGGGYGPERALAQGDWRRELPLFSDRSRAAIARALEEVVRPIARRYGTSPPAIALAWALAQNGVTAVIAGASSEEQARENAKAGALRLDASEMSRVDAAFAKLPKERFARVKRIVKRALRR
jgi:aryl-alcohol dehydrogenase-like predicted oxidoreductase